MTHDDTPWFYIDQWSGIYDAPDIRGAQVRVAEINRVPNYKANVEFILRACNNHDDLMEAIEFLLFSLKDWEKYNECALPNNAISLLRNAYNKAKEKQNDARD